MTDQDQQIRNYDVDPLEAGKAQAFVDKVPRKASHLDFLDQVGAYSNIRPGEYRSGPEAVVRSRLAHQSAVQKARRNEGLGRAPETKYSDRNYYDSLPLWADPYRYAGRATKPEKSSAEYEVMERTHNLFPADNLNNAPTKPPHGIGLLGQPKTQGAFWNPMRPRDPGTIKYAPQNHPGWPGVGRRPLGAAFGQAGPVQHADFSEKFQPERLNKGLLETLAHEFNHNLGRYSDKNAALPGATMGKARVTPSGNKIPASHYYSQYKAPEYEDSWYGNDEDPPPEGSPNEYLQPVTGGIRQTPAEQLANRESWLNYATTTSEMIPRFGEEALSRMHDTVDPEAYTGASDEPGTYSLDLQNPEFTNTRVDPGSPHISDAEVEEWAKNPRGTIKTWQKRDPKGYEAFRQTGWPGDVMRMVP